MIIYKKGDLVELAKKGAYDVILHGANCFGKMEDGIALQIALNFPEALKADRRTILGDKRKLGSYTKSRVALKSNGKFLYIINCYTQYGYAGMDIEKSEYIDYEAYEKVMKHVARDFYQQTIAMPLIGSGHAGEDMDKILKITEKIFKYNTLDIIVYSDYQEPEQLHSLKNKCLKIVRHLT